MGLFDGTGWQPPEGSVLWRMLNTGFGKALSTYKKGASLDQMKEIIKEDPDFVTRFAKIGEPEEIQAQIRDREQRLNAVDPERGRYMLQLYVDARKKDPVNFNYGIVPDMLRGDFDSWHYKSPEEQRKFHTEDMRKEKQGEAPPHMSAEDYAWHAAGLKKPAPSSMGHQAHADEAARNPNGLVQGLGQDANMGLQVPTTLAGQAQHNAMARAGTDNPNSLVDLEREYEEASRNNDGPRMQEIGRRIYAIDPYAAHAVR